MFDLLSLRSVEAVVFLRKRSHNRLLLWLRNKLRNGPTCCCSLTQRLVSWSSPVVPNVWIKTQRRVEKGQKMGRAEAIKTWDVDFQRCHCWSVCRVVLKGRFQPLSFQTFLSTLPIPNLSLVNTSWPELQITLWKNIGCVGDFWHQVARFVFNGSSLLFS